MVFIEESLINNLLEDKSVRNETFQYDIKYKSKEAGKEFIKMQIDSSKNKVNKTIEGITNRKRDICF